jgi:uroporphyrinogen decarboxylase
MDSRQRVIKTLTFQPPDRTPRDLWSLPYISLYRKDELESLLKEFPTDITGVQISPGWNDDQNQALAYAGRYTDEWGSIWVVAEPGVVGEVKVPIISDWSALSKFKPPWAELRKRDYSYANILRETSDKFILSECTARLFERMQFLRGTQNLFMDLAYGTQEMIQLLEMVHEYYMEDILAWCNTGVDGIMFMDDWGSKERLLIHPRTWQELFKPKYQAYVDLIHSAGKFAFFHSDGNIQQIYPDLVELGIDAINSQLFTMDIERLAEQFKGKITFWGEIDRQYLLPFGTPEEVRQGVLRIRRAMDDGHGGIIAQCEWGKDNPMENIQAVYKAWLED